MMCEECTNDYGKITSSPQFNCHGCWDILQLQLFQRKKENARLRDQVMALSKMALERSEG